MGTGIMRCAVALVVVVGWAAHAASGCHDSCNTCQDGMSGPDGCLTCKNSDAPLTRQAGQQFGSCARCDPVSLRSAKKAEVLSPVRFQVQGPVANGTELKSICLVKGTASGLGRHAVGLGTCYDEAAAHSPPDLWLLGDGGHLQWRKDAGTSLGSCPQKKSCVGAKLDDGVHIFEDCAKAAAEGWKMRWVFRFGLLRSLDFEGKCITVEPGAEGAVAAKCVLEDCVSSPSATNAPDTGVRYTDGINGERGGKERWLQCTSDCEDAERFPPNGRCYVAGPLRPWGTCMPPHKTKPTIESLEDEIRKVHLELGNKIEHKKKRIGLLHKRCLSGGLDADKTWEICQAAGNSKNNCLDAGCKWHKKLDTCYFNQTEIPCAIAASAGSCAIMGHCEYTLDAAGRMWCTNAADEARDASILKQAKLADNKVQDDASQVHATAVMIKASLAADQSGSVEALMAKAREAAKAAASQTVPSSGVVGESADSEMAAVNLAEEDLVLDRHRDEKRRSEVLGEGQVMELSTEAKPAANATQQAGETNKTDVDEGKANQTEVSTPTSWFKKIPDIQRPDDGCAMTCMHGDLQCSGTGKCVVPRRECVKLCAHADKRILLQAKKSGEEPRMVQFQATCAVDRASECVSSEADTADEKCKWRTNTACSKLKVLWQDRPGTDGKWETDHKGEPRWVELPSQDAKKCASVGDFKDFCRDFAVME